MVTKILFYLFIKPLSFLPLWVLYGFSNFFAFILKYVVPYRKEVIMTNLRNSFPDKTESEIKTIKNKFIDYFADLMVESIKVFSISAAELKRRVVVNNPEVIDQFHAQGKHVAVATGHFSNWEMAATGVSLSTKHRFNGVFSPLKNKFMNQKLTDSRTSYGTLITSKKIFKTWIKNIDKLPDLHAITFIGDQSATYSKNVYWMNFLNQETAVMFGAEKYAKEYNLPFVVVKINCTRRGYYDVTFELITENPRDTPHGYLTEAHTKALESWINERPHYWLWTHRRWKRKRKPEEVLAN